MSGFILAVGNTHRQVAAKMVDQAGVQKLLEFGPKAQIVPSDSWTLVQWSGSFGEHPGDLVVARQKDPSIDTFLVGYLTAPEPVTSQTPTASSPFPAIARRVFASDDALGALEGLNGSFALINVASGGSTVQLHSDRFGSRSVWRCHRDGTWLFASHPALIWLALGKREAVNPAALGSLLLRARPSGDGSLLAAGRRNLPGYSYLLRPDGGEESSRWFHPRYEPSLGHSPAQWGNRLASELADAAKRLTGVTEKPLLFLSGGLDSRLAVAALATAGTPDCLTLCDGENYETKTARMVARAVGAPHHTVRRDKLWYLRVMSRASLLQGGNYHPAHSHFSEGLRKVDPALKYDGVLLGDFLEAFQKLLGEKVDALGPRTTPEALCDHVLTLDGQYAASEGLLTLDCLREPLRARVKDAWRADLLPAAKEALSVSSELPVSVDHFLRWRSAFEVATYGMIEDIRSVAPERSISMDNKLHELMCTIPAGYRRNGRLSLEALKILNRELVVIPNANTMLPAQAPYWCHKTVKWIRPRLGRARQRFNRKFGITGAVLASSWTDLRLLAATDPDWTSFIGAILGDPAALPGELFDTARVQDTWRRYRAGELRLGFAINSLVTFGIIHKHFGSGELG